MRKTKRRVLKTKRRVLKTKRRKTQRKFKYQRGGETDDDLILKIQAVLQEIDTIEETQKQEEIKYREERDTAIDSIRKTTELRQKVNNAKKTGILYNNSHNMITQLEEELKIAEKHETMWRKNIKISKNNLIQNIKNVSPNLINKKEEAVLLLQRYIKRFPKQTNLGARQLIAKYSKPESEYSFDTDAETELDAIPYEPQAIKQE